MAIACATIFFHADAEELAERYRQQAEQPSGYLTRVSDVWVFVEAQATETADWARQLELAAAMSEGDITAISVLLVGEHWALALAHDGRPGPVAVYLPDDATQMKLLPERLLAIEQALDDLFPEQAVPEKIDALFGALLEGALPVEEGFAQLLEMLGVPPEWVRWSWYETIPEQLFIDPDLAERVVPLGEAGQFWEE